MSPVFGRSPSTALAERLFLPLTTGVMLGVDRSRPQIDSYFQRPMPEGRSAIVVATGGLRSNHGGSACALTFGLGKSLKAYIVVLSAAAVYLRPKVAETGVTK